MPRIAASRRLCLAVIVCTLVAVPGLTQAQDASPAPPTATASPAAAASVDTPDGSWVVTAFDWWGEGLVEPRRNTNFTLSMLEYGALEGETGCGRYIGGYSLDGERLGMRILSKGFDECGARKTEEAVAFSVALETVRSWQPSESGIELIDEDGVARVTLERSSQGDLLGEWIVTHYAKANGTLVEPHPERLMALTLTAAGTAHGSTGCRFFEGKYLRDAERLTIGPIKPIGLRCEGPGRKPGRRLLNLFGEVVRWGRDGDVLTFVDAFDEPLLVLVPPMADPVVPDLEEPVLPEVAEATPPADAEATPPADEGSG